MTPRNYVVYHFTRVSGEMMQTTMALSVVFEALNVINRA